MTEKNIKMIPASDPEVLHENLQDSAMEKSEQEVYTARQEYFMKEAMKQAKKAAMIGEVPIGCVIVREDRIIARGYNRRKIDKNTLSHAELNAIRKASKICGDWRLEDCDLYVTLEPCQMCAGAIVQARIPRVYIGTMNPKAGCAGSILNILDHPSFNHQVETHYALLEKPCSEMLTSFFKELRVRVRKEKEEQKPEEA